MHSQNSTPHISQKERINLDKTTTRESEDITVTQLNTDITNLMILRTPENYQLLGCGWRKTRNKISSLEKQKPEPRNSFSTHASFIPLTMKTHLFRGRICGVVPAFGADRISWSQVHRAGKKQDKQESHQATDKESLLKQTTNIVQIKIKTITCYLVWWNESFT